MKIALLIFWGCLALWYIYILLKHADLRPILSEIKEFTLGLCLAPVYFLQLHRLFKTKKHISPPWSPGFEIGTMIGTVAVILMICFLLLTTATLFAPVTQDASAASQSQIETFDEAVR